MTRAPLEIKLLAYLAARPSALLTDAARDSALGLSADQIRSTAESLKSAGLLDADAVSTTSSQYTSEGQAYASSGGLPEVQLIKSVQAAPDGLPISELGRAQKQFGLPNAKKQGWVEIIEGRLSLTSPGREVLKGGHYPQLPPDPSGLAHLPSEQLDALERRGLIKRTSTVSQMTLSLTPAGKAAAQSASADPSREPIVEITREMLLRGAWEGRPIQSYDLSMLPPASMGARRHPISRLRERISDIFLQMGFEQMDGPAVESCFWNFDALFQPQDHPARDLADTFYVDAASPLPDAGLVKRVRSAHRKGWRYSWQSSDAMRTVLRTHTTAVSARTLAALSGSKSPKKYFSIGKVFRNEATDYKHLAEFFQVEGIVAWEGATFPHLLGFLKQFYSKLGFEKIRFRPSYFPYTEPSLEIEVFYEPRGEWLELGGAGILRPEVSKPLCGRYPVLAWGLSLERPLMLASRTEDIRTLYKNNLDWLRAFPLNKV